MNNRMPGRTGRVAAGAGSNHLPTTSPICKGSRRPYLSPRWERKIVTGIHLAEPNYLL